MKTEQDIRNLVAGDTAHIPITVEDADSDTEGDPKDLTGASVAWALANSRGGDPIIEKSTGSGGITITDATNGEFRVEIEASETESLQGSYYHEAEVTDNGGNDATVTTGEIYVLPQTV